MSQELIVHETETVRRIYKGTVIWSCCDAEKIEAMEVRPDDVFVATFPRSGTTMTSELVYLIVTKDFETARNRQLDDRVCYVDFKDDRYPYFRGLPYLECLPKTAPRVIKTHLHYFLLPTELRAGKGKIIHLMRNPKDVLVSSYKLFKAYKVVKEDLTFNEWFDSFLQVSATELVLHSPWTEHLKEYWAHRNDPNVLLLRYEEVAKDKVAAIKSIASFLDKVLTEEEVEKIADHCSLENMKRNPMTNLSYVDNVQVTDHNFGEMINQGGVGTSKEWFTPDMNRRLDELIEKELAGTGLEFPDMC